MLYFVAHKDEDLLNMYLEHLKDARFPEDALEKLRTFERHEESDRDAHVESVANMFVRMRHIREA